MKRSFFLLLALVFLIVAPLQAAPVLTIDNVGDGGFIPGNGERNQMLNALGWPHYADGDYQNFGGYYNANLWVANADRDANLTIEWIGWEAALLDTFTYGSTTWSTTGSWGTVFNLPNPPTIADVVQNGLIPFSFGSNGSTVDNGNNNPEGTTPNFFISFWDPTNYYSGNPAATQYGPTSGTTAYVFLDDTTGGDNHDDFVVRISVSEVPIPAGAWLLAVGLAGLIGVRRKVNRT